MVDLHFAQCGLRQNYGRRYNFRFATSGVRNVCQRAFRGLFEADFPSVLLPFTIGAMLTLLKGPEQRATFANISFRDRIPPLKTSNGTVEPIRSRNGGRKRKAKVSKEGTHEDDVRPRKKNEQPSQSHIDSRQPDLVPSNEQLLNTLELMIPDDNEPFLPTPIDPTASTPSSDLVSHLGLPEQHPDQLVTEMEVDKSEPLQLQVVAKKVDSTGTLSFKMASSGSWITGYEYDRLRRIEENRKLLSEVMTLPASQILMSKTKKIPVSRQRRDRLNVSVPATRILPQRQAR